MSIKSELIDFLKTCSPCGNEKQARNWFINKAKTFTKDCKYDVLGNVYCGINTNSNFSILLEGHIDEIGGQVLDFDDNGHIFFRQCGGLDNGSLIGAKVTFFEKEIDGVIGRKTLHTMTSEEEKEVLGQDDIWIDCGFKNKKEAMKALTVGDYFTFSPNVFEMGNDCICSKGIDDKIGAFIALKVVEKLRNRNFKKFGVYAAGTVQEEEGGFGAMALVQRLKPTIVISLDVDFATDIPDAKKSKLGTIKLGGGLVYKNNCDVNLPLLKHSIKILEKNQIKFTLSASAWDGGGTNAGGIKYQNGGIATLDVGIPNRYMHTQTEVISFNDIVSGINGLVKIIESLEKNFNLLP